ILPARRPTQRGTRENFAVKKLLVPVLAGVFFLAGISSAAESPVTISVDAKNPGATIAPDFSGLSFEVSILLPNENGVHYFRPDNLPLIKLFHTLGIKNLRIGGNTSDRDVKKLSGEADLDSLFAFTKAANVKVIYCLRLHNGDPQADAARQNTSWIAMRRSWMLFPSVRSRARIPSRKKTTAPPRNAWARRWKNISIQLTPPIGKNLRTP